MNARRIFLAIALSLTTTLTAQVDPSRFTEMRWRMIGPFRGGRTVAARHTTHGRAAIGSRSSPSVALPRRSFCSSRF